MNTAAAEWAERVAARNAIETAKARGPQYIQGKLATSRRINVDGVIALQMGVRSLMKRHFDRQRNWARRRERVAEDSKRTTASAEHGQEAQA